MGVSQGDLGSLDYSSFEGPGDLVSRFHLYNRGLVSL